VVQPLDDQRQRDDGAGQQRPDGPTGRLYDRKQGYLRAACCAPLVENGADYVPSVAPVERFGRGSSSA
jgi:hypothetical protein